MNKVSTTSELINSLVNENNVLSQLLSSSTAIYIDTLEKTNQQLGLWYNPYGIIIGVLSILFTILTMTVAYIIYKQSGEYRKAYLEAVNNFEIAANNKINIIIEKLKKDSEDRVQFAIDEQVKRLGEIEIASNSNTKESREEIEKINSKIKKLEKEKANVSLDFKSLTTPVFGESNFTSSTPGSFVYNTGTLSDVHPLSLGKYQSSLIGVDAARSISIGKNYCSNCGSRFDLFSLSGYCDKCLTLK